VVQPRPLVSEQRTRTISIVDADPDLADVLDAGEVERARREAITGVSLLSPGTWDAAAALEPGIHHRGFLVIDGLLSREVDVLGRRCVELLGHGDVMRPWRWDDEGSHVQAEIGWQVLEPTRLARLDHELVRRIVPWPQLGVELFNRGTRRAHHLAIALAIAHHQRVDDRLLLTLWHLAERWGRVRRDGSCRCRSATSASPTSSAPTAPRSRPRWATWSAAAPSAATTPATGCCTAPRPSSCATTAWRR
jgi:CRP/FNR family cyclic AMP-dependent transcriptional regulator